MHEATGLEPSATEEKKNVFLESEVNCPVMDGELMRCQMPWTTALAYPVSREPRFNPGPNHATL